MGLNDRTKGFLLDDCNAPSHCPFTNATSNQGIMTKRQEISILACIVLMAFVLRALFIGHGSLSPDEALYLYISENLATDPLALKDVYGRWFYYNPPLFMYLLSGLTRINILELHVLAHILTVAMDTGIILISFFIGKKLFGTVVGLISALLLAVNPLHWCMSSRVLLDIPLTFFIYLALLALILNKHIAFYSLSLLSVLTKYPAATLFFVPLIREQCIKKHPRLWFAAYFGSLSALILALTQFRDIEMNQLRYFMNFFKLPDIQEIYKESHFFLGVPVCFFFIVGVVTALRKLAFSPLLNWVILFGTARLFLPWHAFRIPRYTLPLYPAIIIFAAYGGVTSFKFLRSKLPDRTKLLAAISCIFLLYVFSVTLHKGYRTTYYTNKNSVGFQALQHFFQNNSKDAAVLTSSPRQIKYMVPELKPHDLARNTSPEQAKSLIEQHDISYIILDRWSPHQPTWALDYFLRNKGYQPAFATEHLIVFTVKDKNRQAGEMDFESSPTR